MPREPGSGIADRCVIFEPVPACVPRISNRSIVKSAESVDPRTVLHDVFGYTDFRPGQEKVIEAVLAGQDCIAVMPTGAGKSLTFMLPARLMEGTVLVVSPL